MVTCQLSGGIGNMLFQIAAGKALALAHGDSFGIPLKDNLPTEWEIYFNNLPTIEKVPSSTNFFNVYTYLGSEHQKIQYSSNIHLRGYFQSYKYFKSCLQAIVECIDISPDQDDDCCQDAVAIHVRRGDYRHHPNLFEELHDNYYRLAIRHFYNTMGCKRFIVFSDDIQHCKYRFTKFYFGDLFDFEFSEGKGVMEDLRGITSCRHGVITANSTFSYWGAMLNTSFDKVVVTPKKWYGDRSGLSSADLCPKNWIAF